MRNLLCWRTVLVETRCICVHSSYYSIAPYLGPYEYGNSLLILMLVSCCKSKDTFWMKNPLERLPKHSDAGADVSLDFP